MRFLILFVLLLVLPEMQHAQQLSNPNANEETGKLYQFITTFHDNPDRCLILGQNLGWSFELYDETVIELGQQTGALPGIIGGQMRWAPTEIDYPELVQTYIAWHEAGGIVEVSMLADNPFTGGDIWDLEIGDLNSLITPGGTGFAEWREQLDFYAQILKELEEAGVPVIFRPLMEMNGNWFWYGATLGAENDAQPYIDLYRDLYNYYTVDWDLNNLIWMYCANRAFEGVPEVDFYYPGDDVVDMVGVDLYENGLEMESYQYDLAIGLGKPFALSEIGPNHNDMDGSHDYQAFVEKIISDYPLAVYAHAWHSWPDHLVTWLENQNFQEALTMPCVVDRDELLQISTPIVERQSLDITLFPTLISAGSELHVSEVVDGLEIYDVIGRSVFRLEGQTNTSWTLPDLSAGTYFVQIQRGNESALRKLMVSNP